MESHATTLLVLDDPMTVDVVRTALAAEPIAFDVYVRPGETTTFRADEYFRY